MHELNRHVHHIAEVLQVASRTLKSAVVAHGELRQYGQNDQNGQNGQNGQTAQPARGISQDLRFQSLFAGNLKSRADAFTDRMKNETRFVSAPQSIRIGTDVLAYRYLIVLQWKSTMFRKGF